MNVLFRFAILAPAVGGTGYFSAVLLKNSQALMVQLGMLLIIPIGFWVGGWIFLIIRLQSHKQAVVRAFGEVLGLAFGLTALLHGVLLTALVFRLIGAVDDPEILKEPGIVLYELLIALGYLSAMIYGSAGITAAVDSFRPLIRIAAGLGGALAIAIPTWILTRPEEVLRQACAADPGRVALQLSFYLLVGSAILGLPWQLPHDVAYPDDSKQKLKEARARVKAAKSQDALPLP